MGNYKYTDCKFSGGPKDGISLKIKYATELPKTKLRQVWDEEQKHWKKHEYQLNSETNTYTYIGRK